MNVLALNKVNALWYGSGHQKSGMDLAGLKSKCPKGCAPLGVLGETLSPDPLQLPGDACSSRLTVPSIFKASGRDVLTSASIITSPPPTLTLLPPSSSCKDHTGPAQTIQALLLSPSQFISNLDSK